VRRPHLIDRLNEGLHAGGKLTLISAPAGFGKTTLLSEWIHQKDEGRRMRDEFHPSTFIMQSKIAYPSNVAWISLDEGDNDLTRFLAYLVAALQTIAPAIREGLTDVFQSALPPAEAILTVLLNDIAADAKDFVLILDDYHVIDARPLDDTLIFLLEHLPPECIWSLPPVRTQHSLWPAYVPGAK
jgi:LuxR family maltose regulon positive regulatory protein